MLQGICQLFKRCLQQNVYLLLPLNWNLVAKAQDEQASIFPFPQQEAVNPLQNIYLTVVPSQEVYKFWQRTEQQLHWENDQFTKIKPNGTGRSRPAVGAQQA